MTEAYVCALVCLVLVCTAIVRQMVSGTDVAEILKREETQQHVSQSRYSMIELS